MLFIKNRGFFLLELVVWIVVAPMLIIALLSLLYPTTKQAMSLQKASVSYKEVILIDQSITTDLMRGNEVEATDALIINGATYYVDENKLIRSHNGKRYILGKGTFSVEIINQQLEVYFNNTKLVYHIFWGGFDG